MYSFWNKNVHAQSVGIAIHEDLAVGVDTYKNGRNSGTIGAQTVFRDPLGTKARNLGLSWKFQDSWQTMHTCTG